MEEGTGFTVKSAYLLVICAVFAAIFAVMFLVGKSDAITDFAGAHEGMQGIFSKYGLFAGVIFGILTLIVLLIAHSILSLFSLTNSPITNPILCMLAFACWLGFAIQLVYFEPHFTNIANAIIFFLGKPLLYSSAVTILLAIGSLLIKRGGK